MALTTKKTYSRRNNELQDSCIKEKENVDPFDELFSSPLKQDVEFKPLSFWGKKVKYLGPKNKSVSCGLYENDSDDPSTPYRRRKKPKSRSGVPHAKKLHLRPTNYSVIENKSNNSEKIDPFVSLRKPYKFFVLNTKFSEDLFSNLSVGKISQSKPSFCGVTDLVTPNKSQTKLVESGNESKRSTYKLWEETGRVSEYLRNMSNETVVQSVSNSNVMDLTFNSLKLESEKNSQGRMSVKYLDDAMEETWNHGRNRSFENRNKGRCTVLYLDDKMEETCIGSPDFLVNEESETPSLLDLPDESSFDSLSLNGSEWEALIEELLEMQNETTVLNTEKTNTTLGDETFESISPDESTVIENSLLQQEIHDTVTRGSSDTHFDSLSKNISLLSNKVTDMTISNETLTGTALLNPPSECEEMSEDMKEHKTLSEAFRNVTTRRRYNNYSKVISVPKNEEGETKQLDETSFENESEASSKESINNLENSGLTLKDNRNLDLDGTSFFVNPVFESTRMFDDVQESGRIPQAKKRKSLLDGMQDLETTFTLKPGKKYLRSMSILKQLRNGNIGAKNLESTKIKGRRFESFVRDMLEMQNDASGFLTMLDETTVSRKTLGNDLKSVVDDKSCIFNRVSQYQLSQDEDQNSSFNDSSCSRSLSKGCERTLMNHTVKICQHEKSGETPSAFKSALGLEANGSLVEGIIIGEGKYTEVSARSYILNQCGQKDVLPFEKYFNERTLKDCKKIGEGVYGEVFMYNSDTVIKIIPIEGLEEVNGEPQKTFEGVISEVVIASKLSQLRYGRRHRTGGFAETKKIWCVQGKYPKYLLNLWNEYDQSGSGSENDSPVMFGSDQLYIVLELAHGGRDLEAFVFSTCGQALSIFLQAAFTLAAAEETCQFEHRDLHWGNLLIAPTKEKFMTFVLNKVEYKVPTKGVKVSIIDFTLSRMSHDGCYIFNDLSADPELFKSEGDYQFEIYRMMQREVRNDWSLFRPKTNIYWLHYTIDKMIKMARYKNKKTQVHKKFMKELKNLEPLILNYKSSKDFVVSGTVEELLNRI